MPPLTPIRLSGLKKNHQMTFFSQKPIYYVHSPEVEDLDSGMKMRKVAGEGQLDKHLKSAESLHTYSLALNTLHLLSPTPLTQLNLPALTLSLTPSCHPLGTFPDFPGKSQCFSSDVCLLFLFFKL